MQIAVSVNAKTFVMRVKCSEHDGKFIPLNNTQTSGVMLTMLK